MTLSSHQRVLKAINHKKTDRPPRDLGGIVSGISKIAYERYLSHIGLNTLEITINDRVQQLAQIDERILERLEIDTRNVRMKTSGNYSREDPTGNYFVDIWGIKYTRIGSPTYPTLYFEMTDYPLANADLKYIRESYSWPKPQKDWFGGQKSLAKKYSDQEYAVIANPPSGGMLEQTIWMRGFDQFLKDLYESPEIIEELLEGNLINQQEFWAAWLEEVGEWTTIVLYGDDYGTQDRELLSPTMWRKLIKPRLRKLISSIKKDYSHIKIMLHSCGSIYRIIPDLIEVGIDILNPIQPSAKNMEPSRLKREFGSDLCFHGGIDTQNLLPKASPQKICSEVQKTVQILNNDQTGYIFATSHNILADVPPENIQALFEALSNMSLP
ncbi:MAG: uroporphyrinogen decarboxylase family protein [Candidatus Hodarchaeales archaeon]